MYKLNFTTVTPLHISNGEELANNFHYTTFRDEIYKIDHYKLSLLLAKIEKIDFSKEISLRQIENWIVKHHLKIIDDASSYSVKIHPTFQNHLENIRKTGRSQIIEFINSNGRFYIPASSIKGALLTPMNIQSLGIKHTDPKIEDRVVFSDSDFVPSDKFSVYRTEDRPPSNNLICLDPNVTFSLIMRKKGVFDGEQFLRSLKNYTGTQLMNLRKEVSEFKSKKTGKLRKADLFLRSIEPIISLAEKGEPIINIGFGGGSWFKIKEDQIPEFKSKIPRKDDKEAAHSSFSFLLNDDLIHIGWCKVEVEEL